jgi:hypothetical protein
LIDGLAIARDRADRLDAGRQALLDLVLEAGPVALPVDDLVAGPDPEQPVAQLHRPARERGGHERTGVDVAVALDGACHEHPRRPLGHGQLQVRIGLVVAQQDVEARNALLDQPVLEREGLDDRVGDDHVERRGRGEERVDARTHPVGAEIGADAVAEHARLADVQGLAGRAGEDVHAGLLGQPRNAGLEIRNRHAVLCRAECDFHRRDR